MGALTRTHHVMLMRDHEIAELVNRLRDVAVESRDTQQLRGRISREISKAISKSEVNFKEWYNHG